MRIIHFNSKRRREDVTMTTLHAPGHHLPSYEDVEILFIKHQISVGVSQAHGMITGYLSSSAQCDEWFILGAIEGNETSGPSFPKSVEESLRDIYQVTQYLLKEAPFDFTLLLPDDDESLSTRAGLLGDWTYGFLLGASLGGLTVKTAVATEVKEVLEQFQELSHIDSEGIEATEEEEKDFTELAEFTRMAAILVYDEHLTKSGHIIPPEQIH